jgi:hypothetical protein
LNVFYFLLIENRNAEERQELDELLSSAPARRRGRGALVASLGGDVVRKS